MQRRNLMAVPVLSLAALCSCAAQQNPQVDVAVEEQAIRAASAQWLQAATARDAAGEAAMYAPDGISYGEHREALTGSAAIQAHIAEEFARNPNSAVTWTTDAVQIAASGDMAYELGSYQWTSDKSKGTMEETGKYVTIWRKIDGAWKAAVDIGVNTVPEAAPPVPTT